ncbi:MAG: LysM peptidoglycan-binding domain-containing protein [Bacteroides sp.]|nr:LysM peptidoglycan-binding domain-containing protein [Bacteroides sp.]
MKFIQAIYLAAALSVSSAGMMWAQSTSGHFMHTVTKGQSLYSISSMYNVSIADIVKLNPGSDEKIKVGQSLKIPQTSAGNQVIFHTIQAGETLYKLSVKHGVSVERICRANPGLSVKNFRVGQVIAIPPTGKASADVKEEQVQVETPQAPVVQKNEPLKPKCRDMHKIERKETVYSISRMYGITEDELIAANPEIKDKKLKKGKFLCIPYAKEASKGTPVIPVQDTDANLTDAQLFDKNKIENKKISTIKAAVVLPFNTDGTGTKDEQVRMVEYYEGFLMAVDSLKEKGVSIDLYTYDSGKTTASVDQVLNKPEMKSMDIIFGPAYSAQVKPMADFAEKNNIRLVVPFSSQGDDVFNNPFIYLINTPQSYLYSEVYEHYIRKFPNANVVFLDAETGHTDKADFIKGLKEELKNNQITFKELKGENINPDGMKLVVDSLRENVIIPTSGRNVALIKVLPQMVITSREHPNYNMKLFGYPEWQTYTDDHLASFFELDTYFYSSFYTNNLFPEAIQFTNAYRKWYSKDMANTFPKYGMLGFDTAFFFLNGLHKYGSNFEESMNQMQLTPIQTGFKFDRVNNWGGFINRKVFFVNFTKNFELIKLDFE